MSEVDLVVVVVAVVVVAVVVVTVVFVVEVVGQSVVRLGDHLGLGV